MGTLRWRRGRRGRRGRQRRRRWWRPVLRMGRLNRLEGQHCRPARVPAAVSPLRQAPRTPTVRCGRRLEPTHLSHGALAGAAGADALSPAAAASLSNRLARSDAVEVHGPGLRPVLVDGVGNGGAGGKDGLKGCSHVVRNNRVVRNRARTVREAPQAATAEPANLAEHLGARIGVGWGWGWVGVAGWRWLLVCTGGARQFPSKLGLSTDFPRRAVARVASRLLMHARQELLQQLQQGSDEGIGLRKEARGAAVVVFAVHARSLPLLGVGGVPVHVGVAGERRLAGARQPEQDQLQQPGCVAGGRQRLCGSSRHGVRTRSEHADAEAQGSVKAAEQRHGGCGSTAVLHGGKRSSRRTREAF